MISIRRFRLSALIAILLMISNALSFHSLTSYAVGALGKE